MLSVLYAPNVIVGTSAVAVGSSAHVGLATFSSFTVFGGDIPALPVLAAVPTPPLGPVWVALLIVAAASGCGGRAAVRAAAAAAVACAGQAGRRLRASRRWRWRCSVTPAAAELGNFGDVGVDQATFAPAVFLWFVGIGALTVAMSGGIARTAQGAAKPVPRTPSPRRSSRAEPEPEPELAEDEPEPSRA